MPGYTSLRLHSATGFLLPPDSPAVCSFLTHCGVLSACVQELGPPSWLYHQAAGMLANLVFFAEPLAHVCRQCLEQIPGDHEHV